MAESPPTVAANVHHEEKIHPFHQMLGKRALNDHERVILMAIMRLSVLPPLCVMTFEKIYDLLVHESFRYFDADRSNMADRYNESFLRKIVHRIDDLENKLSHQLETIKNTMANNQQTALTRLQTVADGLQSQMATMSTNAADAQQKQEAATARVEAAIAELRDNAGSGNADAMNAVADKLEASLTGFKAVNAVLTTIAENEVGEGVGITIDPADVILAPGATQQFTVSMPSNFATQSGSVDATGLYTAPSDPSVTSDQVKATSKADAAQTAIANITIVAQ